MGTIARIQNYGPDIVLPADLTEVDQWVLWKYENETKVPYQTNGRKASSTDPATWTSYEEAAEHLRRYPGHCAGLGFVFHADDPFCGIDLDNSLDEHGDVQAWARGIVEKFGDTYMEISPSGKGLKIWARGSIPSNLPKVMIEDGGVEMYNRARYFTVTGHVFRGAPLEIEEHQADLLTLFNGMTLTKGDRRTWPLQPLQGGRIPYGQQHSMLVSLIGTLRARRVCDHAIEACLQVVNEKQCERPGPRENISRMVRSSRNWGRTA